MCGRFGTRAYAVELVVRGRPAEALREADDLAELLLELVIVALAVLHVELLAELAVLQVLLAAVDDRAHHLLAEDRAALRGLRGDRLRERLQGARRVRDLAHVDDDLRAVVGRALPPVELALQCAVALDLLVRLVRAAHGRAGARAGARPRATTTCAEHGLGLEARRARPDEHLRWTAIGENRQASATPRED